MNFPHIQLLAGEDANNSNDALNQSQDQNSAFSQQQNALMRQMQQQLVAQQQGNNNQQQQATQHNAVNSLGQLQNFDANALMSAFQQATTLPGQNPLQEAESILASVLAAANSSAQSQSVTIAPQAAPQAATQPEAYTGIPGLDQLQNLNPAALQQAVAQQQQIQSQQQQQQQAQGLQHLQPQSLNGLQGLQQQLVNLQQQLGGQPQAQNLQPQQQSQQSSQSQQQSQQQAQTFQQPYILQQQQQIPAWMSQMGNQAGFNPAALQQLGGAFGGVDPSALQQDGFMNQLQGLQGQNGAIPNITMAIGNPAAWQQLQHQQFQQQQLPLQMTSLPQPTVAQQTDGQEAAIGSGPDPKQFASQSRVEQPPERTSTKPKRVHHIEKKKRAKSFPEKLMQAMMEHGDEEAVAWLPDGKSFVVVNPDLFCDEILNKIFKESKYASFVRKLHRWGFVRLTSGTGTDCFHHPQFQRNKKDMSGKISCAPRSEKDKEPKSNSKPPSLAGVEKFIRAKVVAAAASVAANAEESLLLKVEGGLPSDDNVASGEV